ncbi:MAG: polysaccharide deacetylase family protein [Cyclobacteriaceae bacterium]|nr:polysaccharide deacetylase family protein [Cyclobacteriaceae bacterium SS2]
MPYFHKTPGWLMKWLPSMTWHRQDSPKTLFLTFDDGPIPEVTPYVLDVLQRYHAKATFFCVGDNIRKHPQVFQEVLNAGHAIGNHTFHHLNGWNTPTNKYLEDLKACEEIIIDQGATTRFFRPPHGRIRRDQRQSIDQQYEIIMWSHLSGDFDPGLNTHQSIRAMKAASHGSIMVFHDSIKAEMNLKKVLPVVMEYFSNQGFEFKTL